MTERRGGQVITRSAPTATANPRASGHLEWRESRNGMPEPLERLGGGDEEREREVAALVAAAKAEAAQRVRQESQRRQRGRCDTWSVRKGAVCARPGSEPFTAQCACGHVIEGRACPRCRGSHRLGCFACWDQDTGRHKCPVRFLDAEGETA